MLYQNSSVLITEELLWGYLWSDRVGNKAIVFRWDEGAVAVRRVTQRSSVQGREVLSILSLVSHFCPLVHCASVPPPPPPLQQCSNVCWRGGSHVARGHRTWPELDDCKLPSLSKPLHQRALDIRNYFSAMLFSLWATRAAANRSGIAVNALTAPLPQWRPRDPKMFIPLGLGLVVKYCSLLFLPPPCFWCYLVSTFILPARAAAGCPLLILTS